MTELKQVYKCNVCGNIVEVLHTGVGELVCCGQPMELQKENTVDAAKEKHVPVVESPEKCTKIKVGKVPHPMDKDHYIEWIEMTTDSQSCRKNLKPGDKPEAGCECEKEGDTCCYCCGANGEAKGVKARAYCNIHGLWTN